MIKEDEEILNALLTKKEEVLEFNEIKAIVKLLLEINNKLEKPKISITFDDKVEEVQKDGK